jgi:hypothetical protein
MRAPLLLFAALGASGWLGREPLRPPGLQAASTRFGELRRGPFVILR